MYDDDPGWRVMFNLLEALYHENTVRNDIAGTVESISHITPELLYECYESFYNPHNMVLTVAGSFEVQTVLDLRNSSGRGEEAADAVMQKEFCLQGDDENTERGKSETGD